MKNMATWKNILILLSAILIVIIGGGLYFLNQFLSALANPKIEITTEYISTDGDFVNGVTIEKIRVDSIGEKGYPIKYTTYYTTSCNIRHPENRPPEPPSKIEFYKPGKYTWDEDTVKVDHVHKGLSRKSVSSSDKLWWLNKYGELPVCPLKFEQDQWYYFTIGNPKVTGIFFFIDNKGKEHEYYLASGVSPI